MAAVVDLKTVEGRVSNLQRPRDKMVVKQLITYKQIIQPWVGKQRLPRSMLSKR